MLRPKFLRSRRHLRSKSDVSENDAGRDVTEGTRDVTPFGEEGLLHVRRNRKR